jgi:hypothetical protein
MSENKQTPLRFTIQKGCIKITAYMQPSEKINDLLVRTVEAYEKVKKIEEVKHYGLLEERSSHNKTGGYSKKPKWREGDPVPACPICSGAMNRLSGQYGPYWGCQKYPNCTGKLGIDVTSAPAQPLLPQQPQAQKAVQDVADDELDAILNSPDQ